MKSYFLLVFLLTGMYSFAQVRTIPYDQHRNTFDNDYSLPAEQRFNISGIADSMTSLVEIDIFDGYLKNGNRDVLYTSQWLRAKTDAGFQFYVSMKYPLRAGADYDFQIRYFRLMTDAEKSDINKSVSNSLKNYISANTYAGNKALEVNASPDEIVKNMNKLMQEGLVKIRTRSGESFGGFSDILVRQLEEYSEVSGKRAKNYIKDTSTSLVDKSQQFLTQIGQQIEIEVAQFFNNELLLVYESRNIMDYPVEKTKSEVAINFGYGGAWFNGGTKNFNYGHAPYAGFSFPLSNRPSKSAFLRNTSISAGVFILNFKDANDKVLKGPIIQRPFYLGLGYKVFKFIRLNAGAVLLEEKADEGGFINTDKIKIRPFVGISAEIRFWADFAK